MNAVSSTAWALRARARSAKPLFGSQIKPAREADVARLQRKLDWRRTTTAISRLASAIAGMALLGIAIAPAALRADPVDNYIAAKMVEKSIPGLALAVIRDGHVIKEKAYGYANLELKAPVTLQTSFPWASTTKIFGLRNPSPSAWL